MRNGSVVDLQISKGSMTALVSGSSLYKIVIKIKPLAPALWISIQNECSGKIDSLIELLQGTLSASVMQIVTRRELGLFPKPGEIDMDCSCPDWADICANILPRPFAELAQDLIRTPPYYFCSAEWIRMS